MSGLWVLALIAAKNNLARTLNGPFLLIVVLPFIFSDPFS
uniref:Uncharacterized protein n=1 Tax=Photobacterium damselae subsp. damselae TaxID=85581 RepID=E4WLD2_PHODD|nr:hypothetical protein [Photobacterium damselae subsp. damselae]